MQYGIRGHDLGRRKPDEVAKGLKSLGYDCVQLVFHKLVEGIESYDDELTPALCESIRQSCAAEKFTIATVGCYQDLANPDNTDINLKLYPKMAHAAKACGSEFVASESAFLAMEKDVRDARTHHLLAMAPKLASLVHAEGATLLLEPVGYQPLTNVDLCRQIVHLADPGTVKFIFDPANILKNEDVNRQQEVWDEWFSCPEFTENLVMIHFKELRPGEGINKDWSAPLGEGVIEWDILREKFKDLPAARFAIREGQVPELVEKELAFMKSFFE